MKKTKQVLCLSLLLLFCFCFLPPQARAQEQLSLYITAKGDTIEEIGHLSGLEPALIAGINNIPADEKLPAGLMLKLPEQPLFRITVQSGDTLWSLAQAQQVSVSQLRAANQLAEGSLLHTGQTLLIPLGEENAAVFAAEADGRGEAAAVLASRLGKVQFIWPLDGTITSLFGLRSRGNHSGLDIAAPLETTIRAAASGTVIEADWKNNAYGYAVMIQHDSRLTTLYAHASQLLVKEGDFVKAGDAIAYVGITGNTTGPHVHFEVRVNTVCCDPLEYLPQKL